MTWPEVERAQKWFRENGIFFVFLGRLVPTVRSLVSVPAGLLKMRFKTFFFASTLGTLGWTALLATAGFKMRENYGEMEQWVASASNAVLVVLAAGYVWRLWTHRPQG
jgi:membrane protein DedA with SNARE-associated domain